LRVDFKIAANIATITAATRDNITLYFENDTRYAIVTMEDSYAICRMLTLNELE